MSKRRHDLNGWYEVQDQPISRVGVFDYHGSQLGPDCPDPRKMYKVFRPAEELSNDEALDSFRLVPFIDGHTMLGKRGKPAESVGIQGVIGDRVWFDAEDGDGVMKGNVKVFSTRLSGKIDAGVKGLSLGYGCVYDWTPGTFKGQAYDCVQRRPRGNHLALVKAGRMGASVSVLDELTVTCDEEDYTPMFREALAKARKAAEEAKARGASAEVVAACDAAVTELENAQAAFDAAAKGDGDDDMSEDAKAKMAAAKAATDEATAAKDAAEAKLKATETALDTANRTIAELKAGQTAADAAATELAELKSKVTTLEAGAMDQKAIFAAVAQRDALAKRLVPHVGVFDHAEMTAEDVAAYGVEKVGLKNVTKGHELTALSAWLDARPAPTPATKPGVTAGMDAADKKTTAAVDKYIDG